MRPYLLKYFSIALIFLLCTGKAFSQWYVVNVNTTKDLYSVNYYSLNDIWIGSFNQIIKTNNAGTTWSTINAITDIYNIQIFPSNIYDLALTSSNNAIATGIFALGNTQYIFNTTNGGLNWNYASISTTGALPRYIKSVDVKGTTCVAVGNSGRMYRSTNSGNSWSSVYSGTSSLISDVKFFSTDTILAVGNHVVLKSVDGGMNWTKTTLSGFFNSVSGFKNVIYIGVESSQTLFRSTDYGLTYSSLTLPFYYEGVIYALNKDTLLAAGTDDLYISRSGGQYWEKFNLPNYKDINMIDFYSPDKGFAVGDSGYAIKTDDINNVLSVPISSFSAISGLICLGDSITLLNTSSILPGYSYQWQLDGTTFSTQYNSGIILNTPGTHTLNLIVSNANGPDTSSQQITVTGHDLQQFTILPSSDTTCSGNYVSFSIPNSQTGVSYQLRKGFSNIGVVQNGNGGTLYFSSLSGITTATEFNVKATRNNGCFTDSLIQYDTVYAKKSGVKSACIPLGSNQQGITNVLFNTINNTSLAIMNYYNDYSCEYNTDLVVGSTYSISVTTNFYGYVKVWIDYDSSGTFHLADEVAFYAPVVNNIAAGNITIPSTHQIFNKQLRMRIAYHTSAIFIDNPCTSGSSVGEVEDYLVTIVPAPVLPSANFSSSTTVTCTTSVDFSNTTYNATSYFWDFGDSTTSTLFNPTHSYDSSGVYIVTLIASNYLGTDTLIQILNIQNPLVPVPSMSCAPISYPYSCSKKIVTSLSLNGMSNFSSGSDFYQDFTCTKQVRLVKDSTYYLSYNGVPHSCAWIDYNNDGVFNNTNEKLVGGTIGGSPTVYLYFTVISNPVFNTPLRLRLLVSDMYFASNCSQICGQYEDYTVFIDPYPPINVNFSANINVCVNSIVNFNNLTQNAISYLWDFGDGDTSSLPNPSHSYSTSGIYTVKLKACNNSNHCDSIIKTNYINVGLPYTTSQNLTICQGDSINVGNNIYMLSGTYLDTLIASNGCDSIISTTLNTNSLPIVSFAANPSIVCINSGSYTLTGGFPNGGTYSGNGVNVGIFNPNVAGIGTHNIYYTYIDSNNCSNKDTSQILVDYCTGQLELHDTIPIKIFPNPTKENFILHVIDAADELQIYNLLGEIIFETSLMGSTTRIINISQYPRGIYFIKVKTDRGLAVRKIIKE